MHCLGRYGCLICFKEIDVLGIQQELAGALARRDRETIYGLPKNELDEKGPSVVSINGVVASLAVTEFLVAVTGVRSKPRRLLTYRANLGIVTQGKTPSTADCYYCTEIRGIGLRRVWTRATSTSRFVIPDTATQPQQHTVRINQPP